MVLDLVILIGDQRHGQKRDRWQPVKILKICTSKNKINEVKRQPTEWEEILHIILLIRDQYPE